MSEKTELKVLKDTLIENLKNYMAKSIKVKRVYFTTEEPEDCTAIKKVNVPFIDGYFVVEIAYGDFVLWCGYIQI